MNPEKLNFRDFLNRPKPTDWDVLSMYYNGKMGVREVAKATDRSIGEIYRIIDRSGGRPNRLAPNHDNVRIFADSGLSVPHIAELTGYTSRNVRYILNRGM